MFAHGSYPSNFEILKIEILRLKNLPNMDFGFSMEPYKAIYSRNTLSDKFFGAEKLCH